MRIAEFRDVQYFRLPAICAALGVIFEDFIPTLPADIALEPVSRIVGAERIVDEMIVTMTHDREMP